MSYVSDTTQFSFLSRCGRKMTAATVDLPLCCPRTRPNITPTRGACRQLFGSVDHDQLKGDHQRELQKLYDEQNLRWNFDFATETPQPGRFSWQKVVATQESGSGREGTSEVVGTRSHGCSSNEISNAGSQVDRNTNIPVGCKRRDVTRKRSLTGKMTDFLRQKKCRLSSAAGKATSRSTSSRLTRNTTAPRQGSLDNFVTRPFKVTRAEEMLEKMNRKSESLDAKNFVHTEKEVGEMV